MSTGKCRSDLLLFVLCEDHTLAVSFNLFQRVELVTSHIYRQELFRPLSSRLKLSQRVPRGYFLSGGDLLEKFSLPRFDISETDRPAVLYGIKRLGRGANAFELLLSKSVRDDWRATLAAGLDQDGILETCLVLLLLVKKLLLLLRQLLLFAC